MKTSLWYLKNYPYLMLIAPWEDSVRLRTLSPGEVWRGADDRDQAFIITQGHMRIRRREPARGLVTVEMLNPGEIVGTLAAPDRPDYLEEAVAIDGCVGYVLDHQDIDYRVSHWKLPPITFLCLEGWRLRRYITHPCDLVFRTLPARLATTLLMLVQQHPGAGREDERVLAYAPHTRHLAHLTGSSVELTQQTLEEWQLRGRLDQAQGRLTLKNVAGFYDLVRSTRSVSVAPPG